METIKNNLHAKLGMKDAISLGDFRDDLKGILGEDLISILLYGNATLHDYHPQSYDKNVLVVVDKQINTDLLKSVRKPVLHLKKMGFETLFVTQENLNSSTDVFPIKYHSIRESHIMIWGKNPMEELDINPVHIRLICEQELRQLSQKLDNFFLYKEGKDLQPILCDTIYDFIETLRVAVLLKTDKLPAWNDAISSVGETFHLDTKVLEEIIKVRKGLIHLKKKELESLFDGFISFVDQMVGVVDRL